MAACRRQLSGSMNKRKGFTLIEVVVAVACSAVLIGGISACYIMITGLNDAVIKNSANLYKIASIRDYIVNNYDDAFSESIVYDSVGGTSSLVAISDDGDVSIASETVASDTQITKISFTVKDGLSFCNITYNDGADKTYSFVVGDVA